MLSSLFIVLRSGEVIPVRLCPCSWVGGFSKAIHAFLEIFMSSVECAVALALSYALPSIKFIFPTPPHKSNMWKQFYIQGHPS